MSISYKSWERSKPFTESEMKQIMNLGLKIQRKILVKQIEMNVTPINVLNKENLKPEACVGYVKDLENRRSFERDDGTKGYYQHFLLIDNSGCITCVAWDLVGATELKNNRLIAIQYPSLKKQDKEFELHCSSYIKILVVVGYSATLSEREIEEMYQNWIIKDVQPIKDANIGYNQKI